MSESFGYLFLLSRRFEYITDSVLKKDGLTTKQLLTLIVIQRGFEETPSISQVAEMISTSHQNVKQIAHQLEKRGFVEMVRDERDRRRWLLRLTENNQSFWDSREREHQEAMSSLFESLSDREVSQFHRILAKLIGETEQVYEQARAREIRTV
ncbi:MAG: MarR family transcriptional regulator [Candidatus Thorarchaeota archaeon]|nr:MAG: MarR family transcriptional regulator [Candidatus Thorarchaeota archaeon]